MTVSVRQVSLFTLPKLTRRLFCEQAAEERGDIAAGRNIFTKIHKYFFRHFIFKIFLKVIF